MTTDELSIIELLDQAFEKYYTSPRAPDWEEMAQRYGAEPRDFARRAFDVITKGFGVTEVLRLLDIREDP